MTHFEELSFKSTDERSCYKKAMFKKSDEKICYEGLFSYIFIFDFSWFLIVARVNQMSCFSFFLTRFTCQGIIKIKKEMGVVFKQKGKK